MNRKVKVLFACIFALTCFAGFSRGEEKFVFSPYFYGGPALGLTDMSQFND